MPTTQLMPHGYAGRPYGSFAGKANTNQISATVYDGLQSYLLHTGGPAGAADGAGFTVVWAGTFNSDDSAMVLLDIPGTVPVQLIRQSDNTIDFIGGTSGAVFSNSTAAVAASLGFLIILASANGTASELHVIHAAGIISGTNTPGSATDLDLTADWYFGADGGAADFLHADTAMWWADDSFIDFSDSDNREQFWDTTLDKLRDPGADGSNPVDGAFSPLVCHVNPAATHTVNRGTGGDADTAGSFTDGTSPGSYAADFSPITTPSIVSGSFANGTDGASSSSANRTLIADYDPGAGSDRKVIAVVCHKTGSTNYFDGCILDGLTWGGVPFSRQANPLTNSAGALEIGYIDEADFPAPGTNAVQINTRSSINISVTVFTVENASARLFFIGTKAGSTSATSATLDIATPYDNALVLTAMVIGTGITDVAATGTGHAIADNYDSSGSSGDERVVIGALAAGAAGAQTLGYTFSTASYTAFSFMIMPVGTYTPFVFDYAPTETAFASAATAHAVNMPATVNSGDLLVVRFGVFFDELQPAGTITTPSGWTLLESAAGNDGATDSMRAGFYAKVANGTEGGTTVDFVTSDNAAGAALVDRIHAGSWEGTLSGVAAGNSNLESTGNGRSTPTFNPGFGDVTWLVIAGGIFARDNSTGSSMYFWGTPNNDGDGQPMIASGAGGTGAKSFGGYRMVKGSSFSSSLVSRVSTTSALSIINAIGVREAA